MGRLSFPARILCFALSLQLAFGPAIVHAHPPQKPEAEGEASVQAPLEFLERIKTEAKQDPEIQTLVKKLEALADELDASPGKVAPPSGYDAFRLGEQYVQFKGDAPTALRGLQIPSPATGINFQEEVTVVQEAHPQGMDVVLVAQRKGELVARHIFKGLDAIAVARDEKMVALLLRDGRILTFDVGFAREEVFRKPIPLVEVARITDSGVLAELARGNIQLTFGTRGLKPQSRVVEGAVLPPQKSEDRIWAAGDIVIYRDSGGERALLGVYDRGIVSDVLGAGMVVVGELARGLKNAADSAELEKVAKVLDDPRLTAQLTRKERVSERVTEAALAFDTKAQALLAARAKACREEGGKPRDCYLLDEWQESYVKTEKAKREELSRLREVEGQKREVERIDALNDALRDGNLSPYWQEVVREEFEAERERLKEEDRQLEIAQQPRWRQPISRAADVVKAKTSWLSRFKLSEEVKLIAQITVGGGAILGGAVHVLDNQAQSPAWAVYAVNKMMEHGLVPSVLLDEAYRGTLMKSMVALLLTIPVTYAIGAAFGAPQKLGPKQGLATLGVRIYAQLQMPIVLRAAKLLGQRNLVPAMQMGLNPFEKVKTDSAVGKKLALPMDVRAGLSNPYGNSEPEKAVLQVHALEKARRRAYAWYLSRAVVAESMGMDPATFLMAEQGKLPVLDPKSPEGKKFASEWNRLARDLALVWDDIQDGRAAPDLERLTVAELAQDYAQAKAAAEKIRLQKGFEKAKHAFRVAGDQAVEKVFPFVANYGMAQWEQLRLEIPNRFVTNLTQRQFLLDVPLAIGLMGLSGARADLSVPKELSADAHSFLWTTPAHRSDIVEQDAIYVVSSTARTTLTLQKNAPLETAAYDPIENILTAGEMREEGFFSGSWRWIKSALNFRKADYAGYNLRKLDRQSRTLQAGLLLAAISRVAVAGQEPLHALAAWYFTFMWAQWAWAWLWDPVTLGSKVYEEELEEKKAEFTEAKADILRGIRLKDPILQRDGYERLDKIFATSFNGEMPAQLRRAVADAQEILEVNPKDRPSAQSIAKAYGPVVRLKRALENRARASVMGKATEADLEVKQAYSELQKAHCKTNGCVDEMNARSLLEYSQSHPPIVTKANEKVLVYVMMTGAILTTVWSTYMSVDSFNPEKLTAFALAGVTAMSATLYGALYAGQKAIIRLQDVLDHTPATLRLSATDMGLESSGAVLSCADALGDEPLSGAQRVMHTVIGNKDAMILPNTSISYEAGRFARKVLNVLKTPLRSKSSNSDGNDSK